MGSVISADFLANEVRLSRMQQRTTLFLCNLAMFIVKNALRLHYGEDYSVRCLQASRAFQLVLERIGLQARLFGGDVCFAEAFANPSPEFHFGGFWDQDHHIWCVTEFTEIVDLTISQMHLHPARTRPDGLVIPPVWWDDVSRWPVTIKYLSKGQLRLDLPDADAADLAKFEQIVISVSENVLKQLEPDDVPEIDMLHGPDVMNELHAAGHPWVVGTMRFQSEHVPMPDYIVQREAELVREWESRRPGEGDKPV